MKNIRWILLVLAMVLLFAGCAESAEPETVTTVEENGVTYTVDRERNIIADGKYTYNYIVASTQTEDRITVFYPDGSSYSQTLTKGNTLNTGFSGGSQDYDPGRYADGEILIEIVENLPEPKTGINWLTVICGAVVLGLGVLDIVKPGLWWRLRYGLYVQNAEPTEFAILMSRIAGLICALVGGFLILRGLLGGSL